MNKLYGKIIFVLLFATISPFIYSQNVGINTTGATPSANAILDLNTGNAKNLGLLIPRVVLSASLLTFNPPMANAATGLDSGMMVFNWKATNQPVGYYYWGGAATGWVNVAGGTASVTADNGLSMSGTTVQLGGSNLIQATNIPLNGYTLSITGSSVNTTMLSSGFNGIGTATPKNDLDVAGGIAVGAYAGINTAPSNGVIISGQVGIGNSTPASSAVIDLTNTMASGGTGAPLLWPMNTNNANISLPAMGEQFYNSATGCFEFYNGSAWVGMGCPCATGNIPPSTPTIAATCSESWQGSSITYTSSITTGVSYNWSATSTNGAPTLSANGSSSNTITWPGGGAGTGTVTLTLTNMCGTSTATQSVTLNADPTISGSASIINSSAGNIYSLTPAPSGSLSYSWSSNNTNGSIPGSTTNSTVSVTAGSSTGTFTLTCIVSYGSCSQTITYPVSVITCPSLTGTNPSTPSNLTCSNLNTLLAGSNTVQYSIAAVAGATSYNWSSSNTNYFTVPATTTTPTVTITAVAAGTANLTVQAANGCSTSNFSAGVAITVVPTTQSGTAGSTISLTVPCGVTSITIAIAGAEGGTGDGTTRSAGDGAIFTQTGIAVNSGDALKLATGNVGLEGTSSVGGGGGGGSFVYDNTTTTLLAVSGGGGGGGYTVAGLGGSTTLTPTYTTNGTTQGTAGTGGAASSGGGAGPGTGDNGGGGAGFGENGITSASGTDNGSGGDDYPTLTGGAGYKTATGGYGGGGGGGDNGGGGGNGSSGDYGGGGGGSGYLSGANPGGTFVNPPAVTSGGNVAVAATNAAAGSITITW